MAEHQNAQATTSKSPNRALWLSALDELEQDFLAFQKRRCGAASTAHAGLAPASSAPEQLVPHPRAGS
jgi:hypothetical protein